MPDEKGIYWDSDLFISRLQRTPGRIEVLEQLTNSAERGQLKIVTSALALVEVAKLPDTALLPEEQERLIVDFFENPYIVVLPLDRLVAKTARQLIRDYSPGLRAGDALHIATALRGKVPILHAYDLHFLNLSGRIPDIRIEEPWCDQRGLPFERGTLTEGDD